MQPESKPPLTAVLVLVLLGTLVKIIPLLAPAADFYGRDPGADERTFIQEELHRGTIAVELLEGPILPLLDYQHASFFGGSLVVGSLALPLFLAFGATITALKITGLFFHAIAIGFLFLILHRWVSARAAWIGGLLFAVSPPGYTALVLTAFGTHVESNAFAMVCLYLFMRAFYDGDPRARYPFLLGILAGFGVWFSYILLIALAVFAAFLFVFDKLFFVRRKAGLVLLGFAIGFAPWIVYNLTHEFSGLSIYGRSLFEHVVEKRPAAAGPLARLGDLFTNGFPHSFFFRDVGPVRGRTLDLLSALSYLSLAAFALVLLRGTLGTFVRGLVQARVEPRTIHPALLFLAYPVAFVLIFVATDFKLGAQPEYVVSYRYVYVVFPFLCLVAGFAFDTLGRMSRFGAPFTTIWVSLLAAGAGFGTQMLADRAQFGVDFHTPAYSRPGVGRLLALKFPSEPERIFSALKIAGNRRTPDEVDEILYGIGAHLRQSLRADPTKLRKQHAAQIPHYEKLQSLLRARVGADQKAYFEPVGPGERLFGITQREAFWESRGGRPSG